MKRLGIVGAAVVASAALLGTSAAVIRPKGAEAPTVTAGRPARAHREVAWARQSTLDTAGFAGWKAIVDRDTDVPLRMWGPNQIASGTVANAAIAERVAREFLAAHLDLLAPGAAASDFVLVANQLNPSGDLRSIGFQQRAQGIAVLGGTISFAFKADRITLVGSTALPHVTVARPAVRLAEGRVTAAASAWLGADGFTVAPRGAVASEQVIVPIIHGRGDIEYTLADQVSVESTTIDPGRWTVYVDAIKGAAFARQSELMYASGTVLFDVPVRAPTAAAGRHTVGAANDTHAVNGVSTTSDANGAVTWTGTAAATVGPGLSGPFVAITNKSGGVLVTDSLTLPVSGMVTWSQATVEKSDSQLASFVYANQVKAFVKAKLNPTLAYLDQKLSVNVNEPQTCNAYSTGDDVHFFVANAMCENTGRMADVVYHEFGHSMHNNSIIPGVGQFNGSLSEGVADTLAVSIIGDSGMGRGFFFNNNPLRELNPTVKKRWPQDATGEPHAEGEIYGEAMWDLRQGLQTSLGTAAGFTQFLKLYYATVQRASDIPSTYAEALAADDTDGDLTNGTPNLCAINAAFGAHGLADPSIALGIGAPIRDNFTVSITANGGPGAACPGAPSVQSVTLDWRVRGGQLATIPMTANGATYSAAFPTQPDNTVIEYKVKVTLSDGSMMPFPYNPADPLYQFYVGPVTTLWCADFEAGIGDWTHTATPSTSDEWEAGPPHGLGGDPTTAHGGSSVLGIDLSHDGVYKARMTTTSAESPLIDLQGHTNVHLQYWRWLGVEDGFYDKATISANNSQVWANFASVNDPMTSEINHIDREWRFQDIDLSAQAATSGMVKLKFALTSDPGFEAGGWTIDDVCIVAVGPNADTCGNGQLDLGEACDDGNTADGDGCSSTCEIEPGGKGGGGCCDTGTSPAGPASLAAIALGLVLRRRRR